MARLLEEDDIDDGLDVDEILGEVNEIDQTLLGYRVSIGSVTQAEETMEEAALSLEKQLKQTKQQRERVRPIEVEPLRKLRRAVSVDVENTASVCRQSVSVYDYKTTAPTPDWQQLQDNAFPIDFGPTLQLVPQNETIDTPQPDTGLCLCLY